MNRRLPAIVGATVLTIPAVLETSAIASSAGTRTYYGPTIHMQYGGVRVNVDVSGGRMVRVWAFGPMDRPRSKQINGRAIPILEREAMSAQSVRGVHKVSGASLTSFAFQASLARDMSVAHLRGA
jgi:uncharacterized protein with FMN-binding domain